MLTQIDNILTSIVLQNWVSRCTFLGGFTHFGRYLLMKNQLPSNQMFSRLPGLIPNSGLCFKVGEKS